jgi:hypothetical protein
MIIIGITAAPNNALNPIILYQAATPAIDKADNNVIIAKVIYSPLGSIEPLLYLP